jgi:transposase
MNDRFWLTDEQMERPRPFVFSRHGKPRVEDQRLPRCNAFVNRIGKRWRDATGSYGWDKTLYKRWKR